MRKVLVIGALLAVMLALGTLQTDGPGEGNVLTLAAIGFVVLAAYASAELGNAWSLPRVTGYILAGTILGPSVSNILSGEVVAEMRMFNTLALGLIATSAGLELEIKQLAPLSKTLVLTTLLKVVLSGGLVTLALLGVAQLVELPSITDPTQLFALAMVMGALSIGTSPSISLAVLSETQAKGRLSDLVLGSAVFKDFVVIVCLAVVGAVAQSLLSPEQALQPAVLIRVGEELGGSLLAGVILGGVLIAYVRFIGAEMLLFVAAMILVVAEMARAFHLELLLVFITAGFVVRNFSTYAHELAKPLELVALPVFVVFFTNAGAGVDLKTTWAILPIALTLFVTRAVAYYVSAKLGSRWGREPARVAKNAWLAYLPQAGVTLGLVGLAAEQHPQISEAISTTGMAVVSLNLFVGPIVLRRALAAARELPEQQQAAQDETAGGAVSSDPPTPARSPARREPQLSRLQEGLSARVAAVIERFEGDMSAGLPKPPAASAEPELEEFKHFVHLHRNACRGLFDELTLAIAELPSQVSVPMAASEARPLPGDSWILRLRLWRHRLRFALPGRPPRRTVPVRLAARLTVERAFAEVTRHAFEAGIYQRLWESSGEANEVPGSHEYWQLLERGMQEWSRLLDVAGSSRCRARQLRFSSVEPAIRRMLEALDEGKVDYWAQRLQAVRGSHVAERHIQQLQEVVGNSLQTTVVQRAMAVRERLRPAVQRILDQLESMQDEAEGGLELRSLEQRLPEWRRALEEEPVKALDELARELRASATMRELGSQLKAAVAELPETLRCLQLRDDRVPRHGDVRRVELRALAERDLIRALIPGVDHGTRAISSAFAQLPRRVRDVLEPSWSVLEALAESAAPQLSQRVQEELGLMLHRVSLLERRAERQVKINVEQMEAAFGQALDTLRTEVVMVRAVREPTGRLLQRWRERLRRRLAPWLAWLEQSGRDATAIGDASDLRRSLEAWHGDPLPEQVLRWFNQAPVRDERVFSAHRDLLERIVDDEAAWFAGARVSTLVRGNVGSGKSSLLNMCELELRNPRVLRFDGEGPEQAGSLFEAMSLALGCSEREGALMRQLQLQRPVVLLDNLDTWLGRGTRRVEELERLMAFITKTQPLAFWLVAIENTTLAVSEELLGIAESFTRVIECRPLSAGELGDLLEARRARAGVEVRYDRTWSGRLLARLGMGSDRELFLRSLVNVSQGNPARALADCVRIARIVGTNLVFSAEGLRASRLRIGQVLSTAQLAVLALAVRVGPLDEYQMRRELGMGHQELQRHLSFLLGAGLLRLIADRQSYEIDEQARWPVVLELKRLGALQ